MSDQHSAVVEPDTEVPVPEKDAAVLETLPDGYALRSPLRVSLWREGGEFVADSPLLDLHAFGDSTDAAVAHLGAQIVDQWLRLAELKDRLAPRMQRQRDRLRDLIVAPGA